MSKNHVLIYRLVLIALSVILVFTLVQSPRATQAAPLTAAAPMLAVKVFTVTSASLAPVTTTYAKLTNLGVFTVHSADSLLELTYNGRINLASSEAGAAGAYFELRVDDVPSPVGLARAHLWRTEGVVFGMPVSITGMFTGLTAGDHTASIWVQTFNLTASQAAVDPNYMGTDVLIAKEYLPFGFAYLPLINK